MAKIIKRTDLQGDRIALMKENMDKYKSVMNITKDFFDLDKEKIFVLIFDINEKCVGIEDVSLGSGTGSSVAHDFLKIEAVWNRIAGTGMKWGLCHNHPYTKDKDGKWVETLVSDGDIFVTQSARQAAFMLHGGDLEYVDHFVLNKEGDDPVNKIIVIGEEFKYSRNVIDKIEKGEI